jgi:hypothetical protein
LKIWLIVSFFYCLVIIFMDEDSPFDLYTQKYLLSSNSCDTNILLLISNVTSYWCHLDNVTSYWRHLDNVTSYWRHLDNVTSWRHLDNVTSYWRHLDNVTSYWCHLDNVTSYWRHLDKSSINNALLEMNFSLHLASRASTSMWYWYVKLILAKQIFLSQSYFPLDNQYQYLSLL